ncbi:MAG: helix-turn-helix domain-containing protein [Candidatus Woesearchaeota archaeon]
MNIEILEKAGLTKNEIKVYLAILEKEESTSGPLIKSIGINSSKVYESLERLENKGLVSHVKKTNKKYFQAAKPERLLDFIEDKKRKLDLEKEEIISILPELNTIKKESAGERQEAVIYQGFKGYRTLLENMLAELNPNGEYFAFASGKLKDVLGPYWYIYQKKKRKFNIKAKCLWDPKVRKQKIYLKEYFGTGRFISKGSYISAVDFFIYNDKVIQVSYETKPFFAVLIISKGMAGSYKELFNSLWKTAEKN